MNEGFPVSGRCVCGRTRYEVLSRPMIVHCCHCSWCQRETGSAFAVNALLQRSRIGVHGDEPETILNPSESGRGQRIHRCAQCRTALWSHYAYGGIGEQLAFLRVGTLDDPRIMPPSVHIFTASKRPWFQLPEGVPAFPGYYRAHEVWSEEALATRHLLVAESQNPMTI
ncbi:MAG: GFA family protein [Haliea sp.]|uniref:GFA family protein n=1 Tax=Haliea sp. TaxID=1932666 RepID=UPI0032EFF8C0